MRCRGVAGYLQQRGREPHDPNEGEPDESSSQRNVLGAAEDEEQGGRRLTINIGGPTT
jgi:hypothetical protein